MATPGDSLGVDAQDAGRDSGSNEAGVVDPFAAGDLKAPIKSEAEKKGQTREQAVELGRRIGEDEANRRGEIGSDRAGRIKRAMDYAAWDYDGRPTTGTPKHVAKVGDFK